MVCGELNLAYWSSFFYAFLCRTQVDYLKEEWDGVSDVALATLDGYTGKTMNGL